MQLVDLPIGAEAVVQGYSSPESPFVAQLMRLGLIPGTRFRVVRVAPLGDPVEIRFRGFSLAIRKHEASVLELAGL